VEHRCGDRFGETTPDKRVSLVSARCVGSCGRAPVAVPDNDVAGKLTPESAVGIIDEWLALPGEAAA